MNTIHHNHKIYIVLTVIAIALALVSSFAYLQYRQAHKDNESKIGQTNIEKYTFDGFNYKPIVLYSPLNEPVQKITSPTQQELVTVPAAVVSKQNASQVGNSQAMKKGTFSVEDQNRSRVEAMARAQAAADEILKRLSDEWKANNK